jgi:uncharacterized peroxidase-related enzyme
VKHHGAGLRQLLNDEKLIAQLTENWRKAPLGTADQAMLGYVEKLTLIPWDMEEKDVIDLRLAGFSDSAILDINQVTAYYAYVNRLADGLGVELEAYWEDDSTD